LSTFYIVVFAFAWGTFAVIYYADCSVMKSRAENAVLTCWPTVVNNAMRVTRGSPGGMGYQSTGKKYRGLDMHGYRPYNMYRSTDSQMMNADGFFADKLSYIIRTNVLEHTRHTSALTVAQKHNETFQRNSTELKS